MMMIHDDGNGANDTDEVDDDNDDQWEIANINSKQISFDKRYADVNIWYVIRTYMK